MRHLTALLILALLLAGVARADDSDDDEFDPWAGMDRNGRIPKVEKPADLPNPGRWRYIPEGRLKPGNVFQRMLVSSVIAPFIFHDSDVGTGFGVTAVDIDFRQQRRQELAGTWLSYTTEGQQNYSFFWQRWMHHVELPQGGVLQEERSFFHGSGGYTRTLTRRFFGLGPGSEEKDETSYRDEMVYGKLGFERSLPDPGDPLVVGASLVGEAHSLGPGHVTGDPNTSDAFPVLFDESDNHQLGWLNADIRYDTRDSQTNPYGGFAVGAGIAAALLQTHGDVGDVVNVFATKIVKVPPIFHHGGDPGEENPPTDTLALGLAASLASGDLPFFALPSLGGADSLRGFIAGRFRDRGSWIGSIEHRFWFLPRGFPIPFTNIRIERVGAAAFYEIGAVFPNESELFTTRVRQSYGAGLRVSLERSAPFRVDVGFSEDGVSVNARFGLPF